MCRNRENKLDMNWYVMSTYCFILSLCLLLCMLECIIKKLIKMRGDTIEKRLGNKCKEAQVQGISIL